MKKLLTSNRKLILIFVLALLIRTWKLSTYPLGFHADEVRVGWNAWSILKTGADDRGNHFALYYNTFGDYRPTGIFYITIPSLFLFGINEFATRLPSALLGALTVFPLYFLAEKLTKNKRIGLLSAIFLAITPWHLATSRSTSEVVVACFFILISLSLFIAGLDSKSKKKIYYSFLLLSLSFLFYHSARIVGPLLMLAFVFNYKKQIASLHLTKVASYLFLGMAIVSLILLLGKSGQSRLSQISLTSVDNLKILGITTSTKKDFVLDNKPMRLTRALILQYTSYFSPDFLIGDNAKPYRYRILGLGIVSIPIFCLFILGLVLIIKDNKSNFLLILLAIGPLPASVTYEDSPNLHRAFLMLPFILMIAGIGTDYLAKKHHMLGKIIFIIIIFRFANFVFYYVSPDSSESYQYRSPQAKEVALYIGESQKIYDKIYVTNEPDIPYPWYAFFNYLNPKEFNKDVIKRELGVWNYKNIVWTESRCPTGQAFDEAKNELSISKVLVIDNGNCEPKGFERLHPEANIIKEFYFSGKLAFRAWEYKPAR